MYSTTTKDSEELYKYISESLLQIILCTSDINVSIFITISILHSDPFASVVSSFRETISPLYPALDLMFQGKKGVNPKKVSCFLRLRPFAQ